MTVGKKNHYKDTLLVVSNETYPEENVLVSHKIFTHKRVFPDTDLSLQPNIIRQAHCVSTKVQLRGAADVGEYILLDHSYLNI